MNVTTVTGPFPVVGKKINQLSVSNADGEYPTRGATNNAGNAVNLVSGIICLPSGWEFLGER